MTTGRAGIRLLTVDRRSEAVLPTSRPNRGRNRIGRRPDPADRDQLVVERRLAIRYRRQVRLAGSRTVVRRCVRCRHQRHSGGHGHRLISGLGKRNCCPGMIRSGSAPITSALVEYQVRQAVSMSGALGGEGRWAAAIDHKLSPGCTMTASTASAGSPGVGAVWVAAARAGARVGVEVGGLRCGRGPRRRRCHGRCRCHGRRRCRARCRCQARRRAGRRRCEHLCGRYRRRGGRGGRWGFGRCHGRRGWRGLPNGRLSAGMTRGHRAARLGSPGVSADARRRGAERRSLGVCSGARRSAPVQCVRPIDVEQR